MMIEPTSHLAVSSIPESEIEDKNDECHHDIGSDEDENDMLLEEQMENHHIKTVLIC